MAAYDVSWGTHRAGTSNRPLTILKSRVSLADFLRSSNSGHPRFISISVTLSWGWVGWAGGGEGGGEGGGQTSIETVWSSCGHLQLG